MPECVSDVFLLAVRAVEKDRVRSVSRARAAVARGRHALLPRSNKIACFSNFVYHFEPTLYLGFWQKFVATVFFLFLFGKFFEINLYFTGQFCLIKFASFKWGFFSRPLRAQETIWHRLFATPLTEGIPADENSGLRVRYAISIATKFIKTFLAFFFDRCWSSLGWLNSD